MNDFEWAAWRDKVAAKFGLDCVNELRLRRMLDLTRDLTVVRAIQGDISCLEPSAAYNSCILQPVVADDRLGETTG